MRNAEWKKSTNLFATVGDHGFEFRIPHSALRVMKTPLAWLNLVHQKKRTLVAVAGVAFAALLVFMQLGFFGAAESTATIVYDQLNYDIILVSPQYIDINRAGTFPAERLHQALAVPGVERVAPVYVSF